MDESELSIAVTDLVPQRGAVAHEIESADDLQHLDDVHEASLLHHLAARYRADNIYSYVGPILLSVNPYKSLPIYTQECSAGYRGKRKVDMPPHLYAVAELSYRSLIEKGKDQSIVITGESGAGKTESTKFLLLYLAQCARAGVGDVERTLLEANPLLEAFGNAATSNNTNSSRFGKFIQIHFDSKGVISGAQMTAYLLEKSRTVHQPIHDRNYHIFYQLLAGADTQDLKRMGLLQEGNGKRQLKSRRRSDPCKRREIAAFQYLREGQQPTADDAACWKRTVDALNLMGISPNQIIEILAAILHLGNVEFTNEDQENVEPSNSLFNHDSRASSGSSDAASCTLTVSGERSLNLAATLLHCDAQALLHALSFRTFGRSLKNTRSSICHIPLNVEQRHVQRDALSKAIYVRLFHWLVDRINLAIKGTKSVSRTIGVLDIFGFENFAVNGLEQLCINYANEKLHAMFVAQVIRMEQQEYIDQGIRGVQVVVSDNQKCLELLDARPVGIFSLIDEQAVFPNSTDKLLLDRLSQHFVTHSNYNQPKLAMNSFVVKHYASDVSYCIDGFLEKNRDDVSTDVLGIMQNSTHSMVKMLFKHPANDQQMPSRPNPSSGSNSANYFSASQILKRKHSANGGKVSVTLQFCDQLQSLVSKLCSTELHFIRCLRPNRLKQPNRFEGDLMLRQLRYSGLHEYISVRKAGFGVRFNFQQFVQRFQLLSKNKSNQQAIDQNVSCQEASRLLVQDLVKSLNISEREVQLGISKVFLTDSAAVRLEAKRDAALSSIAVVLQKYARGWRQRRAYAHTRDLMLVIQRTYRIKLARRQLRSLQEEKMKELQQALLQQKEQAQQRQHGIKGVGGKLVESVVIMDQDVLNTLSSFEQRLQDVSGGSMLLVDEQQDTDTSEDPNESEEIKALRKRIQDLEEQLKLFSESAEKSRRKKDSEDIYEDEIDENGEIVERRKKVIGLRNVPLPLSCSMIWTPQGWKFAWQNVVEPGPEPRTYASHPPSCATTSSKASSCASPRMTSVSSQQDLNRSHTIRFSTSTQIEPESDPAVVSSSASAEVSEESEDSMWSPVRRTLWVGFAAGLVGLASWLFFKNRSGSSATVAASAINYMQVYQDIQRRR
eukprot:GILJ01013809.1.p1 GENE.GILJ01013809.1~~GILJ01013809.1.p1  ORF type:complete len:1164 (-),score=170.17 GILJ01013809.1:125-3478(-)